MFHERAQRGSKILFLPVENKIHIFKPPCNVLFIIKTKRDRQNNRGKLPKLRHRLTYSRVRLWIWVPDVVFMNFTTFTSGIFPSKTLVSI